MALTQVPSGMLAPNTAGNGPAFSAYLGTNQSVTQNVWTKIQFNTEEYDTASVYDNITNFRFQPLVPGYYQVNASVDASGSVATTLQTMSIYKNGTANKTGESSRDSNGRIGVSALVFLNGSTDYAEIYAYVTGTSTAWSNGQAQTYFQASMVRAA